MAVMEAGGDGKPLWRPAASILRHWKILRIEIIPRWADERGARNRSIWTTFGRADEDGFHSADPAGVRYKASGMGRENKD